MLTVETTHLKPAYVRRNGLARSEKATVREHFIRNGNILTWITIVNDPAYLTEPMVRTREYEYAVGGQIPPYPCEPVDEIVRPKGVIPHHLPGANPFLTEFATAHKVPLEGSRGGAETMYPDYRKKLKMWMGPTPTAKFPGEVN
jgi:hypothetical protein